ncbi:hypothetical protein [Humibacter ginsengisoli]
MEISESRPASWLLRVLLLGAALAAGWVILTVVLGVASQSAHAEDAIPDDIPAVSSSSTTASTPPSTQSVDSSIVGLATGTSNDLASTTSAVTSAVQSTVAPLTTAPAPTVDSSVSGLGDTGSSAGTSPAVLLDAASAAGSTLDALDGTVSNTLTSAVDVVRYPAVALLGPVPASPRPVVDSASQTSVPASAVPRTFAQGHAGLSATRPGSAAADRLPAPFGTPPNEASGCLGVGIGIAGSGAAGGGGSAMSPNLLLHAALTSAAARLQPGDRLPPAPPESPEVSPD